MIETRLSSLEDSYINMVLGEEYLPSIEAEMVRLREIFEKRGKRQPSEDQLLRIAALSVWRSLVSEKPPQT